jgi:hypothetical protein
MTSHWSCWGGGARVLAADEGTGMTAYTTATGRAIRTGNELGRGGEGTVYAVIGDASLVAKIYGERQRTAGREAKLQAMIARPPDDAMRRATPPHVSIAWPVDVLYDGRQFVGFVMPHRGSGHDIVELFNPRERARLYSNFDWRYCHTAAANLAQALAALHASGAVMGDVNQKNVCVTAEALVTLVDTDSFQVRGLDGTVHRCEVGMPEYTPAELQGQSLAQVDRTIHHDAFGLAVLIYQLLMDGRHPFMGVPAPEQAAVSDAHLRCIREGLLPWRVGSGYTLPPAALPFETLDPAVRGLMEQCFVAGHQQPSKRPTAAEWMRALHDAAKRLRLCTRNPQHWYGKHTSACPWCAREPRLPIAAPPSAPVRPAQVRLPAATAQQSTPGTPAGRQVPNRSRNPPPPPPGVAVRLDKVDAEYVLVPIGGGVPAFWIMRMLVTNDLWRKAVAAGVCSPPKDTRAYNDPQNGSHPVVYVSRSAAADYARWVGGSLPRDTEWTRAALGSDGRTYPWGSDAPDNSRANCRPHGPQDTTPVGSYPAGVSPFGLLDMLGNVWEWVDHLGATARGGSYNESIVQVSQRRPQPSAEGGATIGFRIVARTQAALRP